MSTTKLRLDGKVVIITGASSGIGEASARLFSAHGAFVVIADIEDDLGRSVAASIGPVEKCSYKHCDVSQESQVKDLVDYAVAAYGRLDVMFSNAGTTGSVTSILELDPADIDASLAVNVRGSALLMKHAARAMLAGGIRGSIVCTASVAASVAGMGPHQYTASKHGLMGLVKSVSGELGKHGIRVNCVSPFGLATPMALKLTGLSAEAVEGLSSSMSKLKGVVLKAEHIAEAALFLASDESAFFSGQELIVDGGFTATPTMPLA